VTRRTVAAIGVFDGVHQGHRALIQAARAIAGDGTVIALTFDPHPQAVLSGHAPLSLATLDQRIDLLREAGADEVSILPFDSAMAQLSPTAFIERILIDQYAVTDVVVGENFRFGARAAGDVAMLADRGGPLGLQVHPQALVTDAAGRWSSTRIREQIEQGDVAAAAIGLGRPYRIEGEVVHGAGRGRTLGYPTANIRWSEAITLPADGVFAGWVHTQGEVLPAAISVGSNPQFAGQERTVEAYVLDRTDLDLYGHVIALDFVSRIRAQQRFADVAALTSQMALDVEAARLALTAD